MKSIDEIREMVCRLSKIDSVTVDKEKEQREYQLLLEKEVENGKQEILEKLDVVRVYARMLSEFSLSIQLLDDTYVTIVAMRR